MSPLGIIVGLVVALVGRAGFVQLLVLKFRRDVRKLNAGDYRPLLRMYAADAVLHFNEGPHRWSGEHRGKAAIESFLREFAAAGLQGQVRGVWLAGPPWALRLVARFDDRAEAPNGEPIYANRVVIVLQTRWGKIVRQDDFYEDTGRIAELDRRLRELGVEPAVLSDLTTTR